MSSLGLSAAVGHGAFLRLCHILSVLFGSFCSCSISVGTLRFLFAKNRAQLLCLLRWGFLCLLEILVLFILVVIWLGLLLLNRLWHLLLFLFR